LVAFKSTGYRGSVGGLALSVLEAQTFRGFWGNDASLGKFSNWTLQNAISCIHWTGID